MSTTRIGINGFGRIGRMIFRNSLHHPDVEIVGINDLCDAEYLSYLLRYDSMHGKFEGKVEVAENALIINGKKIPVFCEKDANNLHWGDVGAEIVTESC